MVLPAILGQQLFSGSTPLSFYTHRVQPTLQTPIPARTQRVTDSILSLHGVQCSVLAALTPLWSYTHGMRCPVLRYRGLGACYAMSGTEIHPEFQYKKPQFQYSLYQECGFLCLISQRRRMTLLCDSHVRHTEPQLVCDVRTEICHAGTEAGYVGTEIGYAGTNSGYAGTEIGYAATRAPMGVFGPLPKSARRCPKSGSDFRNLTLISESWRSISKAGAQFRTRRAAEHDMRDHSRRRRWSVISE
eukprot:355741-Rhodomonas_salina.2